MKPAISEPADQPDLGGIVRKIQKLMDRAQGGRGATEEEAATATRMVQELLTSPAWAHGGGSTLKRALT